MLTLNKIWFTFILLFCIKVSGFAQYNMPTSTKDSASIHWFSAYAGSRFLKLPDCSPTAFFCRMENKLNPTNKRLLVFRLGTLEYTNRLEYASYLQGSVFPYK